MRITGLFFRAALCTCALAFPGLSPSGHALERDDLRLHVSFERDSLSPAVGVGQASIDAPQGKEKTIGFAAGKRGRGVHIADGKSINYQVTDVFSETEGTVACWVKPVGWRRGDGHNHYFMRVCGDKACFLLYKFYPGNTWVYLEGYGKTDVVGGYWDQWEDGQWTFLAFTFKPGEQAWYVNGEPNGRKTEQLLEPSFSSKAFLQLQPGNQVIDEIMVFRRALTAQEVKAVYAANRRWCAEQVTHLWRTR